MNHPQHIFILFLLLTKLVFSASGEPSIQQDFDGSAAAYTDAETGERVVPKIELKDGKKYYNWPMWNKSKNRKLQMWVMITAYPTS